MALGNMFGGNQITPATNLWVGNNYSSGYSQMSRSNYPAMNQNNIPQYMQNNSMGQPQSINNILQVMGPESAQAYLVGPESQVILMDSDKPVFYIKRTDSSGYSETHAFEFHEIPLIQSVLPANNAQIQEQMNNYITKTEFEEFKKMIEDLVMKNE